MVEKLNSTVLNSLHTCTDKPTDWVDCLQSVAMSICSQPHESTGLSPYEMMFGIPMHFLTELEDSKIPESATPSDLAQIMPKPPSGDSGAAVFTKVDKIHQIIHNSASGNISRAKSKQMYYFSQRHRGTPLQLHDKVLHYNHRAGQHLSDKLHGKALGPYEIVGIKPNGKYQLKDSSGYILKTYINASNLKLYLSPNEEKEKDNGNLPDLVHAQDLPPLPDTVDELLKSIQYEKSRPKSRGLKRELPDMDILFPGPESYRKEKKKKPNSDENTPPISDNTCQAIPPSKAEQDWKASQVKIIKPAPLTAETPDETSLSTSPSSDKSSTPKPPQTESKFFSKNRGILKNRKMLFWIKWCLNVQLILKKMKTTTFK